MAQRSKAKQKTKSSKNSDKEQSERFKEAARKIGADDREKFSRAIEKIVPAKKRFYS